MATHVQGVRLSDVALTNIDLIDRNLYERTCDVRWWATDPSLVDALADKSQQNLDYASKRLGVILSAYTVYYDLVLCDLGGNVVANGRPDEYGSQGADVSTTQWFRSARATHSGDEYGFAICHASSLVDNKLVLGYSCQVREGGNAHGQALGVLGILFNWDDLAQVIVKRTPLSEEEWGRSRVCIIDDEAMILADSRDQQLKASLEIDTKRFFAEKKSFSVGRYEGRDSVIAHSLSPGYETYATGWHSVIVQELKESNVRPQD